MRQASLPVCSLDDQAQPFRREYRGRRAEDLTRIGAALAAIDIEGERYPEQLTAIAGR